MAFHQITSVDSNELVLGNYDISTSATAGGTFTSLGSGQLTSFQHNFTNSDLQSGNSVDPIEYNASILSVLQCGLTETTGMTSTTTTITAGGAELLTPRAWKMSNRRLLTTTINTIITVFSGTIENGMTLVPKSDNDDNPINMYQFSVRGELDSSLSVGAQLFTIVKDEEE